MEALDQPTIDFNLENLNNMRDLLIFQENQIDILKTQLIELTIFVQKMNHRLFVQESGIWTQ